MTATVATTPRSDDCARGWALNEADRKLAASTSPTGPQPAQSLRLIQSAYRNTVENNMRRNRNEKQKPQRRKNKDETIDIGDLLIETPLMRWSAA